MEDLYKILEVSRTASNQEIKLAYKSLAKKYHPDRNQGDKVAEEKFKQINNAYQVLSDTESKAKYDLMLNYAQFQESVSFTGEAGHYTTRQYHQARRRTSHTPPPRRNTYEERVKVGRESITIASLLIIISLVVVGGYTSFNMWNQHQRKVEQQRQRQALLQQAQDYYNKGDYRETLEEINRIYDKHLSVEEIRLFKDQVMDEVHKKASLSYEKEDYKKALEYFLILQDYETVLEKQMKFKVANCYERQDDDEKAIDKLKEILLEYPDDFNAHYLIGKILSEKWKDFDEAIKHYDEAANLVIDFYKRKYGNAFSILLDPEDLSRIHFDIFNERAQVYFELGEYKKTVKDCSWASFLKPYDPEPLILKGKSERKLGNGNAACNSWSKAVELENEEASGLIHAYCR